MYFRELNTFALPSPLMEVRHSTSVALLCFRVTSPDTRVMHVTCAISFAPFPIVVVSGRLDWCASVPWWVPFGSIFCRVYTWSSDGTIPSTFAPTCPCSSAPRVAEPLRRTPNIVVWPVSTPAVRARPASKCSASTAAHLHPAPCGYALRSLDRFFCDRFRGRCGLH